MKWKCTYLPEEQERAAADLAALLQRHPGAKVRRDKSKAPKLVVYLTYRLLSPPPRRRISPARIPPIPLPMRWETGLQWTAPNGW